MFIFNVYICNINLKQQIIKIMKPLIFFLEMFANKEYYNLIKYSIINNDLESRIKADDLAPDLHDLWFECNSLEILELEEFIINN